MVVYLVGAPNVGKSVLFNRLTGSYATVSNYPGTTVEVTRGWMRIDGREVEVVDTPGMYSLSPVTEDERVAQRLLLENPPDLVVHVIDAKNIDRMLPTTIALLELGLPLVLALNMADEAAKLGYSFDCGLLSKELGCPVLETVATTGTGIEELIKAIGLEVKNGGRRLQVRYPAALERALSATSATLKGSYRVSRRALAMLLLQGDETVWALVSRQETRRLSLMRQEVAERVDALPEPPLLSAVNTCHEVALEIIARAVKREPKSRRDQIRSWLGRIAIHPLFGMPLLFLVLYYGLYRFVGVFIAGTVVDYLDHTLFSGLVSPLINRAVDIYIPFVWLRDLLAQEYGIFTLALRYAVAIILPIVAGFFFVFSVIEDSGYLPRAAVLLDRFLKKMGLSGRASIPLILGLGCDTMATVVTRTLETRREKIIATFLLALAVPCSAQLGVIMAILSTRERAVAVWAATVLVVFLAVGRLANTLLPGEAASFHMDLPPLRLPCLGNIVSKTVARVRWYFLEVLPVFVAVSVLIWVGRMTGLFDKMLAGLTPVLSWIGLPKETASVFFLGFFRRDYGAAGLYDLAGTLSTWQLIVAAVTLTLFVPCVAQFAVMIKERGFLVACAILAVVFLCALSVGFLLNGLLAGAEFFMLTEGVIKGVSTIALG